MFVKRATVWQGLACMSTGHSECCAAVWTYGLSPQSSEDFNIICYLTCVNVSYQKIKSWIPKLSKMEIQSPLKVYVHPKWVFFFSSFLMKWERANPPVRFVLFGALIGLSSPPVPVTTFYHTESEGNSSAAETQMSRGKLHPLSNFYFRLCTCCRSFWENHCQQDWKGKYH